MPLPSVVEVAASVNSGKSNEEARSLDMDKALNAVAAQVYDNVHMQLGEMQIAQLEKTNSMANEVKQRMEPVIAANGSSSVCHSESSAVVACLKAKGTSTAQCADLIELFSRCSNAAVNE